MNYADRGRAARAPQLHTPRNARAAAIARERDEPLFVSFVGDLRYANPTVYCDSGERYDWSLVAGLHVIVAAKTGIDASAALVSILEHTNTITTGYPVLLLVDREEVACVVHGVKGKPVSFWPIRRGSELWQKYFAPQP